MDLRRIVVVAFDYNGVLIDDARFLFENGVCYIFRYLKRPTPTFEEYQRAMSGGDFMPFYRDREITQSREELNRIMQEGLDRFEKPPLSDGAFDLIRFLRDAGITVGVVSSREASKLLEELGHYGILSCCDFVFGGVNDKRVVLDFLVEDFTVENDELLYVGDTVADVEAAQEVPVISCAKTGGYSPREAVVQASPDILVDSLVELRQKFEEAYNG